MPTREEKRAKPSLLNIPRKTVHDNRGGHFYLPFARALRAEEGSDVAWLPDGAGDRIRSAVALIGAHTYLRPYRCTHSGRADKKLGWHAEFSSEIGDVRADSLVYLP